MPVDLMRHAASPGHSPCIGHCTHDPDGLCLSCRRHDDEVKAWRDLDETARLDVWARLPAAIDGLDRGIMRLPLDADDITALAAETLTGGGCWMAGFEGCWVMADHHEGGLQASNAAGARINLDFSGKVRAVAWANGKAGLAEGITGLPILLVTPVARLTFPVHEAATRLDDGRLDQGLGLASVRLLTEDDGGAVIETPLARVDGLGAISPPQKPAATPPGLDLGKSYALGAILLPKGVSL
ncbi:MAG: DUF1289 domain-containing protein [Candidatus Puniceispirillales bacterium]